MKTASAQPLQFSGYPLQLAEISKGEKLPVRTIVNETATASLPEMRNKLIDAPENWDESWFANYE
jgi:hypothetical protein